MKSLLVVGRRWFQKLYGNTYHTAEIYVDGKLQVKVGPLYGYGDQYIYTAANWLEAHGYLPGIECFSNGNKEGPAHYCQRNGITFAATVADVRREKDL